MKGIVFDLDDTLYNEKEFVYGAFKEVACYLSDKYTLEEKSLFEKMLHILHTEGRGKIFDRICQCFNLNEDIDALVELYRKAKPVLRIYEDARMFLEHNTKKCKLGLITDGVGYVQWNKIKQLGIENHFDSIIVTDDLGKEFWKPSQVPYIKMAESMGLSLRDMVYVGDNPNKDFCGAKQLKMLTVRILREQGDYVNIFLDKEYEADFTIKSLNELEKILQKNKG
ncbi:MAG: HAD family hydrolase [Clostridia bacterium]|nr:HAD family hydrolase [Clostridia bacterium]